MKIDKALLMLGYTQSWLDFGVLTKEILTEQVNEFEQGKDKNTEHFRYTTFCNFIENYNYLSDLQVENFIKLTEQDNDKFMAGNALKLLFLSNKLTISQFNLVAEYLVKYGKWAEKVIYFARQREQYRNPSK